MTSTDTNSGRVTSSPVPSEIQLLSFSDIAEELQKHHKYLANPLTKGACALILDMLRLLKPHRATKPVSLEVCARAALRKMFPSQFTKDFPLETLKTYEAWSVAKAVLGAAEVVYVD